MSVPMATPGASGYAVGPATGRIPDRRRRPVRRGGGGMGFRTNPDRILENIDRARSRESDAPRSGTDLQANVRELDTEVPDVDATAPERTRRIFRLAERTYMKCAQSVELGPLAARFQAVG